MIDLRFNDVRRQLLRGGLVLALLTLCVVWVTPRAFAGTRGSDELFWLPSFDQALEMSRHTRRPILLMYYTLVDERAETFSGKGAVC